VVQKDFLGAVRETRRRRHHKISDRMRCSGHHMRYVGCGVAELVGRPGGEINREMQKEPKVSSWMRRDTSGPRNPLTSWSRSQAHGDSESTLSALWARWWPDTPATKLHLSRM